MVPLPCSDAVSHLSHFWLSQLSSSCTSSSPCPRVNPCHEANGPEQMFISGWSAHQGGLGKPASILCSFCPSSLPSFRSKQACVHCHEQRPGFPQLSCYSQMSFNQPRGLKSPVQDPRTRAPDLWLPPLTPHPCILPFWPDCVSPPLPHYTWIFLTVLVVEEFFCQFPVTFHWELLHT